jgi:multidrug resistance efflux pump
VAHHQRDEAHHGILEVSPAWSWVVTTSLGVLVAGALALSILGRVEITEQGRGILRSVGGTRALTVHGPGLVAEVFVHPGDPVRAGDPILRLESPELRGQVMEAEAYLRTRIHAFATVASGQSALFGRQVRTAEDRLLQLRNELESYRRSRERAAQRLAIRQALHKEGIVGREQVQDFEDQVDQAEREVAAACQRLGQAGQELEALQAQRKEQVWNQSSEAALARARKASLGLSLEQTHVTAPIDGVVDSIALRPGDRVPAGGLAAKVVPTTAALVAIAFLPERHRCFVNEGDLVELELAQFPRGEFGTLQGRIRRLAKDLAGPADLQDAFGPGAAEAIAPSFRVEIGLEPARGSRISTQALRPGAILQARFTLRRQRLITLLIEPLRRWLR